MKGTQNSPSGTQWLQRQLPRLIGMVVILFVGYVIADIAVELLFPSSQNAQGSLQEVFAEMKFFSYWVKKLVFSVGAAALYGAVLWHLSRRTLREA